MNMPTSLAILTPREVAKRFVWIMEAQAHVNSCAEDFERDPECVEVALELQRHIDSEWDKLGALVSGHQRPHSILRGQHGESWPGLVSWTPSSSATCAVHSRRP